MSHWTRNRARALLGLIASLGLVGALALPVAAGVESNKVWLHEPHRGSDSSTFQEDEDCGDYTSGVVWHFILNKYDGDDTAHLVADFETAGTLEADATKVVGAQHFYLNTPDDDVLLDAYAEVDGDPGDANLVLSHVCHAGDGTT